MADFIPQAHHAHTEKHGCGCQGNCRNCPRRQGGAQGDEAHAAPDPRREGDKAPGA